MRAASDAGGAVRAKERATKGMPPPSKAAQHEQEVKQRLADHEASRQRREADAAKNAKEHASRAADAKAREERVRKRQAERTKPPASALKDPA